MSSPPVVDNNLQRWRNQLIDLTRRNPLLSLKPRRSSFLSIASPAAETLFASLVQENGRKPWPFWLPPEDARKKKSTTNGAEPPPETKAAETTVAETTPDNANSAQTQQATAQNKQDATKQPKQAPVTQPTTQIVAQAADGETLSRTDLLRVLQNLYRRAHTDYQERGLHVLFLAFGVLEWRDADDETLRSPLVLVPVDLRRRSLQEPFVLAAADEETFLNPALEARLLQDFDFPLPPLPDWDDKPLERYLEELNGAITGLPGWRIDTSCMLTLFSFFKGVIHQDLGDHSELVLAHPLIQTLSGLQPDLPHPDVSSEEELDASQDPARTFHILDADGSQRRCLEAAARSESFVLIGPPGTGKSQTITNLIADSIAVGKKVLFVSEKMAALEVVYERLRHAGLGDYCLELHSHKANKRAVVTELARCLSDRPHQGETPRPEDYAKLRQRRQQLQQYVDALHTVREPVLKSVWEVLAELPQWHGAAALPLGLPTHRTAESSDGMVLGELTLSRVDELGQLATRLQQLFPLHANCLWQGFQAERYTLQLRDEILALIDKVIGKLDRMQNAAVQFGKQIGAEADIHQLLKIGDLLEHPPAQVVKSWLGERDLPALERDLENCTFRYEALQAARAPLTERYGNALWSLPEGTAEQVAQAWQAAASLLDSSDADGAMLLRYQQKLRGWTADTQKRVPAWLAEIRTLEKWLSVPLPDGAGADPTHSDDHLIDPSPHTVKHFVRLVHLAESGHAPERTWLHNADTLTQVQQLIAAIKPAFHAYREGKQQLQKTYTDAYFDLELDRIADAFQGPYRSWFRIFNGTFRKDRRDIRRRTHTNEYPETVAEDAQIGKTVVQNRGIIQDHADQRTSLLGRYDKNLDTDIDEADRAARVATESLEILRELGCEKLPVRFVDTICSTARPTEKMRLADKRLAESFSAWMHATEELKDILPMDHLPGIGQALEECSLTAIVQFARELQNCLNQLAALTDPILGHTPNPPQNMATLIAELRSSEDFRSAESAEGTENKSYRERFGPAFVGLNTDWKQLQQSLAWTRRVREWCTANNIGSAAEGTLAVPPANLIDRVTQASAKRDKSEVTLANLKHALDEYENSLHSFEIRFASPGPQLDGKKLVEHPTADIRKQLERYRDGIGQLGDWIDWQHLPERFDHLGLRGFLDQVLESPPPPDRIVATFYRSLWSAWIDMMFENDDTLKQFRRAEHETLLAEFRDLDHRFIEQGAARVVEQAEKFRSERAGEQALLMKEAHKKTKHIPLRRLFESIPGLVLDLKPCLLMSPLSVSQYLPADPKKMLFDLVVFDEASQILPEDAIGALYRGKQAVITGDNRQLPPTTFFQLLEEGDGDEQADDEPAIFESILDAFLAAGLPSRMLRWHYRSRHENLIAFSNATFYDGKLVTFPAALERHADLGIHFHHVADGVYERGSRRINAPEANAVADQVCEHFRIHPDKTLGVIAFSYPQMNAIQDEIDRRLVQHPELESFVDGSRLEGFFIKNLETVQGDERDVIILSVGYGPDADGKLTMNFGPLNRDGGARRLNVAVTRAREKLIVVSSIRSRDLSSTTSDSGVGHLQSYLDFAERGPEALPAPAEPEKLPTLTPLHEDVMQELHRLGFEATPLIGCGSYRLDLAVRHPDNEGSFLLGIEFDGPSYASAHTSRDRDRIRPAMLESLHWQLHRIWTPDWIFRRGQEVERLHQSLRTATTTQKNTLPNQ